MKKEIALTYVLFLISFFSFSQLDNETKVVEIPAQPSTETNTSPIEVEPIETPSLSNIDHSKVNGLSVPRQSSSKPKKKEFSMFGNDNFDDPAELFQDRVNKQTANIQSNLPEGHEGKIVPQGDIMGQFFGKFKTNSEYIRIVFNDFGEIDGDIVSLLINNSYKQKDLLLKQQFTEIKVDLINGLNAIDIVAMNQGLLGYNTARFKIIDDKGKLLLDNSWFLATGGVAAFNIYKMQ